MANNRFQHKRSSVSGVVPTTGDLSVGELGINLADKKLFSANSSVVFELGSNLTNIYVGNTTSALTVNSTLVTIPTTIALSANGSNGTAGQVLTSNGAGIYWSTVSGGGGGSVNTAEQYSWTNTHTFNANLTIAATSELIIANGAGIEANGTFGTSGQVLTSNSTGVYWSTVSGGSVAGSNTQVQFNDSDVVNASAFFTFNKVSNTLAAVFMTDIAGRMRDVPILLRAIGYQLTSNDSGQCISTTTGGIVVNGAVLASGFTATIFNNSASTLTITSGTGVTMYLAGTATTGNRTLSQRGLATVVCVAANTFVITGSGLF
jgi:hypothetical protein